MALEVIVGLIIVVGLIGIVVTVLPGGLLIGAAIGVWAAFTHTAVGWWTFGIAATVLILGAVGSKVLMARQTQQAGTANASLIFAAVLGIVGFFVVPLIGLPLGFVLGLWLAEYVRLRDTRRAWASAKVGLKATGWGMLIELASGLIAGSVWLAAATLT
ncbi:MAG: DUF456 domain-containing protein [Actinobacteria bacterium HGW-Actinobacteria-2]|nr:MAG: DUF456 domain-containing protein [Actinobacteria bacterium HGW-Actinobacteria-2]